ncbi:MAG: oxidoreductase, partial [Planctomycetes bacterium]|nr:oxidoreductase [Planctomycetota bacterium]
MIELHLPWLEIAILTPVIGALLTLGVRDPEVTRRRALIASGLALIAALGVWRDFNTLQSFEAHDRWDILSPLVGADMVVVDELSAPLLPLAALLYFLVILATLRTKVQRFPFGWTLVAESLLLAMLSSREPWAVIILLAAQTIPPYWELRARGRPTRV